MHLQSKGVKGPNAIIANYLATSHASAQSRAALVVGNPKHGQHRPNRRMTG